ncbi:unnamed protein product [Vitrella brassicaformis CCMP3155]|uniref:Uncharacterized protein n=10 Tax=Vitrella brassicaformis TaxID=1169539 RepID=A0A0G4EBJ8_VITBC|nr:unnamed protein product [Vitrella brassicaformis CCMP3155]|eukprot:CEL93351.1 unnamed protein product [Vitrella brassicaformis CCMP3155]
MMAKGASYLSEYTILGRLRWQDGAATDDEEFTLINGAHRTLCDLHQHTDATAAHSPASQSAPHPPRPSDEDAREVLQTLYCLIASHLANQKPTNGLPSTYTPTPPRVQPLSREEPSDVTISLEPFTGTEALPEMVDRVLGGLDSDRSSAGAADGTGAADDLPVCHLPDALRQNLMLPSLVRDGAIPPPMRRLKAALSTYQHQAKTDGAIKLDAAGLTAAVSNSTFSRIWDAASGDLGDLLVSPLLSLVMDGALSGGPLSGARAGLHTMASADTSASPISTVGVVQPGMAPMESDAPPLLQSYLTDAYRVLCQQRPLAALSKVNRGGGGGASPASSLQSSFNEPFAKVLNEVCLSLLRRALRQSSTASVGVSCLNVLLILSLHLGSLQQFLRFFDALWSQLILQRYYPHIPPPSRHKPNVPFQSIIREGVESDASSPQASSPPLSYASRVGSGLAMGVGGVTSGSYPSVVHLDLLAIQYPVSFVGSGPGVPSSKSLKDGKSGNTHRFPHCGAYAFQVVLAVSSEDPAMGGDAWESPRTVLGFSFAVGRDGNDSSQLPINERAFLRIEVEGGTLTLLGDRLNERDWVQPAGLTEIGVRDISGQQAISLDILIDQSRIPTFDDTPDDRSSKSGDIVIYADGDLVYRSPIPSPPAPQHTNIFVAARNQLVFSAETAPKDSKVDVVPIPSWSCNFVRELHHRKLIGTNGWSARRSASHRQRTLAGSFASRRGQKGQPICPPVAIPGAPQGLAAPADSAFFQSPTVIRNQTGAEGPSTADPPATAAAAAAGASTGRADGPIEMVPDMDGGLAAFGGSPVPEGPSLEPLELSARCAATLHRIVMRSDRAVPHFPNMDDDPLRHLFLFPSSSPPSLVLRTLELFVGVMESICELLRRYGDRSGARSRSTTRDRAQRSNETDTMEITLKIEAYPDQSGQQGGQGQGDCTEDGGDGDREVEEEMMVDRDMEAWQRAVETACSLVGVLKYLLEDNSGNGCVREALQKHAQPALTIRLLDCMLFFLQVEDPFTSPLHRHGAATPPPSDMATDAASRWQWCRVGVAWLLHRITLKAVAAAHPLILKIIFWRAPAHQLCRFLSILATRRPYESGLVQGLLSQLEEKGVTAIIVKHIFSEAGSARPQSAQSPFLSPASPGTPLFPKAWGTLLGGGPIPSPLLSPRQPATPSPTPGGKRRPLEGSNFWQCFNEMVRRAERQFQAVARRKDAIKDRERDETDETVEAVGSDEQRSVVHERELESCLEVLDPMVSFSSNGVLVGGRMVTSDELGLSHVRLRKPRKDATLGTAGEVAGVLARHATKQMIWGILNMLQKEASKTGQVSTQSQPGRSQRNSPSPPPSSHDDSQRGRSSRSPRQPSSPAPSGGGMGPGTSSLEEACAILEEIMRMLLSNGHRVMATLADVVGPLGTPPRNGFDGPAALMHRVAFATEATVGVEAGVLLDGSTILHTAVLPCLGNLTALTSAPPSPSNLRVLALLLRLWPRILRLALRCLLVTRQISTLSAVSRQVFHPIVDFSVGVVSVTCHFLLWFSRDATQYIHPPSSPDSPSPVLPPNASLPPLLVAGARYVPSPQGHGLNAVEHALRSITLTLMECSAPSPQTGSTHVNPHSLPRGVADFVEAFRLASVREAANAAAAEEGGGEASGKRPALPLTLGGGLVGGTEEDRAPTAFSMSVLEGDKEFQEACPNWTPFHPSIKEVERALVACLLHLSGYSGPPKSRVPTQGGGAAAAAAAAALDDAVEQAPTEMAPELKEAFSLARRAAMRLLADVQRCCATVSQGSTSNRGEDASPIAMVEGVLGDDSSPAAAPASPSPFSTGMSKHAEKKEEILGAVLNRCVWLLNICPRGVCRPRTPATGTWAGGQETLRRAALTISSGYLRSASAAEQALSLMLQSPPSPAPPKSPEIPPPTQPPNAPGGASPTNNGSSGADTRQTLSKKPSLSTVHRVIGSHREAGRLVRNVDLLARLHGSRRVSSALERGDTVGHWARSASIDEEGAGHGGDGAWYGQSGAAVSRDDAVPIEQAPVSDLLGHFLSFLCQGPDVKVAEDALRIEHLSSLFHYITLRSLRALLLAGLCAQIPRVGPRGATYQADSGKGGQGTRSFPKTWSSDDLEPQGKQLPHSGSGGVEARLPLSLPYSDFGMGRKCTWPVILDLLVGPVLPPSHAYQEGSGADRELPAVAVRYGGWLLLSTLHAACLQLLARRSVVTGSGTSTLSAQAMVPFGLQPISETVRTTMNEMICGVTEWHLQRNPPFVYNLVQSTSSSLDHVFTAAPDDALWVEATLRLLVFHVCTKTRPLDTARYVVPFLHHLLQVAFPPLQRLVDHRGNGPRTDLTPQTTVPLERAVTAVVVRRYDVAAEHVVDRLPLEGFTTLSKFQSGNRVWVLMSQAQGKAPAFTPPLSDLSVQECSEEQPDTQPPPLPPAPAAGTQQQPQAASRGDTVVRRAPFAHRSSSALVTWLLTGKAAGEASGDQLAIADCLLEVLPLAGRRDSEAPDVEERFQQLQDSGFTYEGTLRYDDADGAQLWSKKKRLVTAHPTARGADVPEDAEAEFPTAAYKESSQRLKHRSWKLFETALWAVLGIGSDANPSRAGASSSDTSQRKDAGWVRKAAIQDGQKDEGQERKATTATGGQGGARMRDRADSDRQAVMVGVLQMVMTVVIKVADTMRTEGPSGGGPGRMSSSEFHATEKFVADLLGALHGCVRQSSNAALMVLKALMTTQEVKANQLEPLFNSAVIKQALYRLITECIRNSPPSDESEDDLTAAYGGASPTNDSMNTQLVMHCLPPLVTILPGGVGEEATELLKIPPPPPTPAAPDNTAGTSGATPTPLPAAQQAPAAAAAAIPSPASNAMVPQGMAMANIYAAGQVSDPFPPSHPQSSYFVTARPTGEFAAEVDERTLRIHRGEGLGGVVLCRAPLTFTALSVGPQQPNNVLTFRLQSAGRFGVTVAPASAVFGTPSEVFERNDVVGFRTRTTPNFRDDSFAAHVLYEVGDLLDVRFEVDPGVGTIHSQSCLRTELMISGESIGSVLEVYFDEATQMQETQRMNLVFVFQDRMTIAYEGPDFNLEPPAGFQPPQPVANGAGPANGTAPPAEPPNDQNYPQSFYPSYPPMQQSDDGGWPPLPSGQPVTTGAPGMLPSIQMPAYMPVPSMLGGGGMNGLAAGGSSDSLGGESYDASTPGAIAAPPLDDKEAWEQGKPLFVEALRLYQALLLADANMLVSLKQEVLMDLRRGVRGAVALMEGSPILEQPPAEARPDRDESPRDGALPEGSTEQADSAAASSAHLDAEREREGSGDEEGDKEESRWSVELSDAAILACRKALSVLAVIGCDITGEGMKESIQESSPHQDAFGLPWLMGHSPLNRCVTYGLTSSQCEMLLSTLAELIAVTPIHEILLRLAKSGPLHPYGQRDQDVKSILLVLGTKALLACALTLRTLISLHPDGNFAQLRVPGMDAVLYHCTTLTSFGEKFLFISSGTHPDRYDLPPPGVDTDDDDLSAQKHPRSPTGESSWGRLLAGVTKQPKAAEERKDDESPGKKQQRSGPGRRDPPGAPSPSPSGPEGGQATTGPTDHIDWHSIGALCGIPADVFAAVGTPKTTAQPVIEVTETSALWRWILKLVQGWAGLPDGPQGPVKQKDGSLTNDSPNVTSKVFNLDGSASYSSKRLATRLMETSATWALKKDVVEVLCGVAALVPDQFVQRLHDGYIARRPPVAKDDQPTSSAAAAAGAPPPSSRPGSLLSPHALNVVRLFRCCIYFISREKDDNVPDYWLPFKPTFDSPRVKQRVYKELNRVSVLKDELYGWQRVFYLAVAMAANGQGPGTYPPHTAGGEDASPPPTAEDSMGFRDALLEVIQSEVLYHLVGSVAQVVSSKQRTGKSPKYCALSPSVHVAHWLLDAFIRHPLAPGGIRRRVATPASWAALFALLVNGSNLPMKLAMDAARISNWLVMLPSHSPLAVKEWEGEGAGQVFGGRDNADTITSLVPSSGLDCSPTAPTQQAGQDFGFLGAGFAGQGVRLSTGRSVRSGSTTSKREKEARELLQSIMNCICYCATSATGAMDSMYMGRAGLDCFSLSELYKANNRHRVNAALIVHFLCAAGVVITQNNPHRSLNWPNLAGSNAFRDHLNLLSVAAGVSNTSNEVNLNMFGRGKDRRRSSTGTDDSQQERPLPSSAWGPGAPPVTIPEGSPLNLSQASLQLPAVGMPAASPVSSSTLPAIEGRSPIPQTFMRTCLSIPEETETSEVSPVEMTIGRVKAPGAGYLMLTLSDWIKKDGSEPSRSGPSLPKDLSPVSNQLFDRLIRRPKLLVAADRLFKHLLFEITSRPTPRWTLRPDLIEQGSDPQRRPSTVDVDLDEDRHVCTITVGGRSSSPPSPSHKGADPAAQRSDSSSASTTLVTIEDSLPCGASHSVIRLKTRIRGLDKPGIAYPRVGILDLDSHDTPPPTNVTDWKDARGSWSLVFGEGPPRLVSTGSCDKQSHKLCGDAAATRGGVTLPPRAFAQGVQVVMAIAGRAVTWEVNGKMVAAATLPLPCNQVLPAVSISSGMSVLRNTSSEMTATFELQPLCPPSAISSLCDLYYRWEPLLTERKLEWNIHFPPHHTPRGPTPPTQGRPAQPATASSPGGFLLPGPPRPTKSLSGASDRVMLEGVEVDEGGSVVRLKPNPPPKSDAPPPAAEKGKEKGKGKDKKGGDASPSKMGSQGSMSDVTQPPETSDGGHLPELALFTVDLRIRSGISQAVPCEIPPAAGFKPYGAPFNYLTPQGAIPLDHRPTTAPMHMPLSSGTASPRPSPTPSSVFGQPTGALPAVPAPSSPDRPSTASSSRRSGGRGLPAGPPQRPPVAPHPAHPVRPPMMPVPVVPHPPPVRANIFGGAFGAPPPPVGFHHPPPSIFGGGIFGGPVAPPASEPSSGSPFVFGGRKAPTSPMLTTPVAGMDAVFPALPFKFQVKIKGGSGKEPPPAFGVVWQHYRWLWLANGRLVCPLDPPLPQSSPQTAMTSPPREVMVKEGITPFFANDSLTVEFQPSMPALLFYKHDEYQFAFHFEYFYNRPGPKQPRQSASVKTERHKLMNELHSAITNRSVDAIKKVFDQCPDLLMSPPQQRGEVEFTSYTETPSASPAEKKDTPLRLAVRLGLEEVTKTLIEHGGAAPNGPAANQKNATPLMEAAHYGHDRLVALLVCVYGADVNQKDQQGWTALHHAVNWQKTSTALLLLRLGADPTIKHGADLTPAEMAKCTEECKDVLNLWQALRSGTKPTGWAPMASATSLRPLRSARWSGLLANCSPVVGLPAMPADASSDTAPIEAKVEVLEIDGERVGQAALAKRTDGLEDEDRLSVSVADNDEDSSQPPEGDAPEGAKKRREGTKDTQGSATASSAPFGDPSTPSGGNIFGFSGAFGKVPAAPPEKAGGRGGGRRSKGVRSKRAGPTVSGGSGPPGAPHEGPSLGGDRPAARGIVPEDLAHRVGWAGTNIITSTALRQLLLELSENMRRTNVIDVDWDGWKRNLNEAQTLSDFADVMCRAAKAMREPNDDLPPEREQWIDRTRRSKSLDQLAYRLLELEAELHPDFMQQQWPGRQREHWIRQVNAELGLIKVTGTGGIEWTPDVSQAMAPLKQDSAGMDPLGPTDQGGAGLWSAPPSSPEWEVKMIAKSCLTEDDHVVSLWHPDWPFTYDEQLRKLMDVLGVQSQLTAYVWYVGVKEREREAAARGQPVTGRKPMEVTLPDRSTAVWRNADLSPEEAEESAKQIFKAALDLLSRVRRRLSEQPSFRLLRSGTFDALPSQRAGLAALPLDKEETLLKTLLAGRLTLISRVNAMAQETFPVISAIFNIPTAHYDYDGLLTLGPTPDFFRGDAEVLWCADSIPMTNSTQPQAIPPVDLDEDGGLDEGGAQEGEYDIDEEGCEEGGMMEEGGAPARGVEGRKRGLADLSVLKKLVLQIGPSDLPVQVSVYVALRPLLLHQTIQSLWSSGLQKMGTPGGERFSIKIDRGRGATARDITDSVWYQAANQILPRSSASLRGKSGDRPFMVVFRGEGASDFGGPFQELLSWLSREVMGKLAHVDSDEHYPEFHVFVPCPNSAHSIGPNQDTVILHPGTSPYTPEPAYRWEGWQRDLPEQTDNPPTATAADDLPVDDDRDLRMALELSARPMEDDGPGPPPPPQPPRGADRSSLRSDKDDEGKEGDDDTRQVLQRVVIVRTKGRRDGERASLGSQANEVATGIEDQTVEKVLQRQIDSWP